MKIGENFYAPNTESLTIDETRPWLIEIGDNVVLTKGVSILTHGYDLSVIMNKTGNLYGSSGKVKIGNNVFVGVNSTILKGVSIGNNVIIGANSLINKNIPDNCVVVGNPAKIIMSLEEYEKKRAKKYLDEAKELAIEYYKRYKIKPTINEFHEFFFLMSNRDEIDKLKFGFLKNEKVKKRFLETQPLYNGLDDFLNCCGIEKENK
ncbi:acyltransferase [Clostridium perfringens]|nr:acyltransferase [Clostridium perfringens]MDK0606753.1 acyltransferase [Clostridium perfringens]MDZ5031032.1 acyltransferase [Clostridium perfringens]